METLYLFTSYSLSPSLTITTLHYCPPPMMVGHQLTTVGQCARAVCSKVWGVQEEYTLCLNCKHASQRWYFDTEIEIINDDILKVSEDKISDQKLSVFGNLPYNISTEILSKWILNVGSNFWFESLILMFQKEVADRIISEFNRSKYGRLSILSSWKLNVKKIIDIKPQSFSPRPKIDSSLLLFTPKENFFELKDPKNLEKITRIFFSQRRKMLKKPFNQVFANGKQVAEKFGIDLNLRPQNLEPETYYKLVKEYEDLRS